MAISGYYNQEALTRNANNPTSTTAAPSGVISRDQVDAAYRDAIAGPAVPVGQAGSNYVYAGVDPSTGQAMAYPLNLTYNNGSRITYSDPARLSDQTLAFWQRSNPGRQWDENAGRRNPQSFGGLSAREAFGVLGTLMVGGGLAAGASAGAGAGAAGATGGTAGTATGAAAGGASSIGTFGGFAPQATGFGVGSGGAAGFGGGIGGGITGGAAGTAGAGIGTWTRLGASAAGQLGSRYLSGGSGSARAPQTLPRAATSYDRARTAWDMTAGDPQLQQQWVDWANNPALHGPSQSGAYGPQPRAASGMMSPPSFAQPVATGNRMQRHGR